MQALSQLSYGPELQNLTEINRFSVKNRRQTLRDARDGVKPKTGMVIPAKHAPGYDTGAGIQRILHWTPACAGVTEQETTKPYEV